MDASQKELAVPASQELAPRPLAQTTESKLSVVGTLREVAMRLPDPADRATLLQVANVHEETIKAMLPGDSRGSWAARGGEAAPTSVDPQHRRNVAQKLGVDKDGNSDWTDICENLRMLLMMRSLAPIEEEPLPLTGPQLQQRLAIAAAAPAEERVDPELDVAATLARLAQKYSGMLEGGAVAALTN